MVPQKVQSKSIGREPNLEVIQTNIPARKQSRHSSRSKRKNDPAAEDEYYNILKENIKQNVGFPIIDPALLEEEDDEEEETEEREKEQPQAQPVSSILEPSASQKKFIPV